MLSYKVKPNKLMISTSTISPLALIAFWKPQCEHQDQYPSSMWDIEVFGMETY